MRADSLPPPPRGAPARRTATRRDHVALAALLLALGWLGWHAGRIVLADVRVTAARAMVRGWADGQDGFTLAEWVAARNASLAALALTPDDPSLHDQLGVLYLLRAREAWRGPAGQRELRALALTHQRAALALRPGHGWTWAALAESLQGLDAPPAEVWAAWRQARRLAPHERTVQRSLLVLAFADWQRAPDDVRQWARAVRAGAGTTDHADIDAAALRYGVLPWP